MRLSDRIPLLRRLNRTARRLKSRLLELYYAYRDPALPWKAKIPVAAALLYALSPIDLIPDFIPVLGYLDDVIILSALFAWALRSIPPEILESARERARKEPFRLTAHWYFAVPVVALWAVVAFFLIRACLGLFGGE